MAQEPLSENKTQPRNSEKFLVDSARVAQRFWWAKLFWTLVVIVIFAIAAVWIWTYWRTSRAGRAETEVRYAWVQMLPDEPNLKGGRLVRAIVTDGDHCPKVIRNGQSLEMDRRPARARAAFPILLCEARIDASSPARIGPIALPSRPNDPTHIVAIGDTGCRVVYWGRTQGCLSGVRWPFAAIASDVAGVINRSPQSIIIHVGDYHYREHACLDRSPDCGGSPYGDNWATWEEEFFKPAKSLLLAAPWVLLRGNHEDCNRAGAGWLYFFALPEQKSALPKRPDEPEKACETDLEKYSVAIGRTESKRERSLVVLDTANERDSYSKEDRCRAYQRWAAELASPTGEVWIALHQPLWPRNADGSPGVLTAPKSPCMKSEDEAGRSVIKTQSALDVLRSTFDVGKLRRLATVVLAGDTHLFQFFRPTEVGWPIQIVVGNGGTQLDELKPRGTGADPKNEKIESYGVVGWSLSVERHGYTTLRREGWKWTAQMHDATGKLRVSCDFEERPDASPSEELSCSTMPDEKTQSSPSG
jgi:hypothetical protein